MIIDLDGTHMALVLAFQRQKNQDSSLPLLLCTAHQGNGHENDKLRFKDNDLIIVDVFNPRIYPNDGPAKEAIDIKGAVPSGTDTAGYLKYAYIRSLCFRHHQPTMSNRTHVHSGC